MITISNNLGKNELIPTVVVIGGGIAGLTTAWKLKEGGFNVSLLESGTRVGGVIDTQNEQGYISEHGPNTILETDPIITKMITSLGLDEEKRYVDQGISKRFVVKNGVPRSLPMSPAEFLFSNYFSWNTKWNLVLEPFRSSRIGGPEESLADFVSRRLGREFLDYAINPFIAGVYAGSPETLSLEHAFPKLHSLEKEYGSLIRGQIQGARERSKQRGTSKEKAPMFSFQKGLKTLTERFNELLKDSIHLNAKVFKIQREGIKWKVFCKEKNRQIQYQADQIIYAGTAHQLPELEAKGINAELFEPFGEIAHPPVSSLTFGFEKNSIEHPLDGYGVLVPEVEKRQILGALFISTLFPERVPLGKASLTVFIGGVRQPKNASLPIETLIDLVLNDLNPLLGIKSEPEYVFHRYWQKAIPQYDLGYEKIHSRIKKLEGENPGLRFCGNYCGGISVADTLLHSLQTAESLLA